jgi:hypothetical protein
MPVTACQVVFIFTDGVLDIGEEHYYCGATQIEPVIPETIKLLKARCLLNAPGVYPKYIRLSLFGVSRDSEILDRKDFGTLPTGPATYVNLNGNATLVDPEQAKACVAIRMEANSVLRRTLFLAGLPSGAWWQPAGEAGDWNYPKLSDNFDNWVQAISKKNWGFVARTKGVGQPAAVPIIGVGLDQATSLVMVLTATKVEGVAVNSQIQVTKQTRTNLAYRPLNGIWPVARIDQTGTPPTFAYLLAGTKGIDPMTVVKPGVVIPIDYHEYPYQKVQPRGATTRKRGNRTGVGPGRKQVKKYL